MPAMRLPSAPTCDRAVPVQLPPDTLVWPAWQSGIAHAARRPPRSAQGKHACFLTHRRMVSDPCRGALGRCWASANALRGGHALMQPERPVRPLVL